MEYYVNMRTLGERILLLRRRAGWSQNELAKQAGIDVMTISRLERGTKKRLEVEPLARLAKALSVTTDYLLGIADEDGESALWPAAVALVGA
jgi:transcriptional regulator with XRE-family HTH domain